MYGGTRKKKDFGISISPTRKLIEDFNSKIHEFNINKIWEWDAGNVRKFKTFAKRHFENCDVIFNMMVYDRQL